MVVGTGDMSELALGWATYNGDHMSMYGVNASVPKTLVRHLVRYYADTCGEEGTDEVLLRRAGYPVSPELLPPERRRDRPETGGPGRPLRAARFLPVSYPAVRLPPVQDFPSGANGV